MIGSADLLRGEALERDQHRHVEVINSSAESLLSLINDILDFAKAEAGQLRLEAVDFRLKDLVHGVRDLLVPAAHGKGLGLEVEIGEEVPEALRGDRQRLRQVLLNLAGNAVKFTSRGQVEIRVSAQRGDDDQIARLHFAVEDTGIGISTADQERIFESFFQAESLSARRFAGTGLGLSICRALISRMGGEMGFESERHVGSTFWFFLPWIPAQGEVPEEVPALAVAVPGFDRGRFRVLVVDDNSTNRNLALSHLERMGYRATEAPDGETALARLEAERFDAVLMDCQMPELDGYETARRWRLRERQRFAEEGRDPLPVIAVTAHALPGERERCLAAGMDDHLAKPYRGAELARVLDRWLRPRASGAADGGVQDTGDALAPDFGDRIEALRRLGEETGRDLLGMAIAELSDQGGELRDQMGRALEEGDASALADAAHSRIASAGALGATRLVELLQAVEARALEDKLEGVRELLGSVEAESKRFQRFLSQMRDEDHAPHR